MRSNEIIIRCDLCKEEKRYPNEHDMNQKVCSIGLYDTTAHLCPHCVDRVVQWLKKKDAK